MRYLLLLLLVVSLNLFSEEMPQVPVAYKGRFRPIEAYSQLWLHEYYHHEKISEKHLNDFHLSNGSANDLIWKIHFLGSGPYNNAPFFWLGNKEIKTLLNLSEKQTHFSYQQLYHAIYKDPESSVNVLTPLILHHFKAEYQNRRKFELTSLAPGLWVAIHHNKITIEEVPKILPWSHFKTGFVLTNHAEELLKTDLRSSQKYTDDLSQLFGSLTQWNSHTENLFKVLPNHKGDGLWLPISALKKETSNFTLYSDEQFNAIRSAYLDLETAYLLDQSQSMITDKTEKLAKILKESYQTISGKTYLQAMGKGIAYPTSEQLYAEYLYYRYPLNKWLMALYACALILLFTALKGVVNIKWGLGTLILAFLAHTLLLILRCYILQRPPVSNMFETVVYVPWVAVLIGFGLYAVLRNSLLLFASGLVAFGLLLVLQLTKMGNDLDNVQAVLDSQYWLIVHVLMVVGSYGAFALSGVLGHFYLINRMIHKTETVASQYIGKCILQSMYIGLILLIPGTVLGGVWAAESWGRFWDWDPKESWAFISICVYLLWVHAYRFHHIRYFGLAVGSIVGLMAISFTWYGVNYILSTGLHSYGFGSGGEVYYYLYLIIETLFLGVAFLKDEGGRMKAEN